MTSVNRISNMLKQTVSKLANSELSSSNSSLYLALRSMSSSSSKLFVGGLSYGTDEPSLKDAFSHYGEVVEAKIVMDRASGRSRGFGFVTFTSSEEASSAISALDGKDLHGRQIRVNYATEKRQGFRGGYGGGYAGPRGYGNGSYGGAGYGDSNNYTGDDHYSGRSGFGSGNYGFGGNNYGSGSGGDYPSGNNSLSNSYSSGGNSRDFGHFSGISPNQGGLASPELDGNASTSYGETQETLSTNQAGPNAAVQDLGQDSILQEDHKNDNDEFSDQGTTKN